MGKENEIVRPNTATAIPPEKIIDTFLKVDEESLKQFFRTHQRLAQHFREEAQKEIHNLKQKLETTRAVLTDLADAAEQTVHLLNDRNTSQSKLINLIAFAKRLT